MSKYKEYSKMDLSKVSKDILEQWKSNDIFEKSVANREGATPFVFYEGPPSANGMPGIHHALARTIKDIFCRFKTLKGFQVKRKAGWDTHGLPVELSVEKELGITKEDIGKSISIEEYNAKCRENVMKYTAEWNRLTEEVGYWVDLDDPYITYDNKYIESVWHLLQKLYNQDLLYKGYSIQPYSPAAGTGLSSHELNQPGTYRDVSDTTVTAQFKVVRNEQSEKLFANAHGNVYVLAWTTTPWTLPSNAALAVGEKINYVLVKSFNRYTFEPITVLLAEDRFAAHFPERDKELALANYNAGDKHIPYEVIGTFAGSDITGISYEQLLPYVQPEGEAFRIIPGDFVTTEDGTGVVHIAPTFGADDARVAKAAGIPAITVQDEAGSDRPLVDLQGRFVKEVADFGGEYVKNEYYSDGEAPDKSVDVQIAIKLKEGNRAFNVEKYVHSYPHCWRTDKPVLYYPLDSWFVRTTSAQERLIELNKTINWKPASTGTGRFGNWLENLQDWNLSRSRFWGIPIPIWVSEDRTELKCIGSVEELYNECEKSVQQGLMESNPYGDFEPGNMSAENYARIDLHRPYADNVVLVSDSGKPMHRESDLIDVWFDSGSMPYAQWHYPFENKEIFEANYPADFIAEGVDQTRGWFFTLHAIGTMCFDSVAYKNVVSNGLVLDKNGQKMSKRLGNAVDPFETIDKYGADATRWYMISNAQPWDDLKFDASGIEETQRKFFRALHNTYAFFALYANIDGFSYAEDEIALEARPEIDRWILSRLNSLIKSVDESYSTYEPTKAARDIQEFVVDHLSNWYVRLCRRRFWKGDYTEDKIAAYQTLYTCLEKVAVLAAPIAPFYADQLFQDLNQVAGTTTAESVHLADFPVCNDAQIDADLENRMTVAQKVSSLILSLRKKENIKVRQPLQKAMIPIIDASFEQQLKAVSDLIRSEVNVRELELLTETEGVLVKKIKPDFKKLGPRFGAQMKSVAAAVNQFGAEEIAEIERNNSIEVTIDGSPISITLEEVEISSEDIPGWLVANDGPITVALDVTITDALREEGIAREFVNRIQNLRKDRGLEVTDKIHLEIQKHEEINQAIENNLAYICAETLANSLELVDSVTPDKGLQVDVNEEVQTWIAIDKLN